MRWCLRDAGVDMNVICRTAWASNGWRGLASIQTKVQYLMRFMISGGGGFFLEPENYLTHHTPLNLHNLGKDIPIVETSVYEKKVCI